MRRFLLPATALVLVVTACGAGSKPAPRLAEVRARVSSVEALAAQRKRAALSEARRLLREFVPPPGARRDPAQRDHGGALDSSGPDPVGEYAGTHRFWRVHESLKAAVAFLRTHDPHGFRSMSATYGSSRPHYLTRILVRGRSRFLNETIAQLPGRTVIRVEAKVGWIYPRSPREKVPAQTSKIVVNTPATSKTVTDPAQVARIVRWFDALPVSPPGIAIPCPLETAQDDTTLSFRSANGAWLAEAKLPPRTAWICDAIAFRIAGKTERPLVDGGSRESFVRRLQALLGLKLIETNR